MRKMHFKVLVIILISLLVIASIILLFASIYYCYGLYINNISQIKTSFTTALLFSVSIFSTTNYGLYTAHPDIVFLTSIESFIGYLASPLVLGYVFYSIVESNKKQQTLRLLTQLYLDVIEKSYIYVDTLFNISEDFDIFFEDLSVVIFENEKTSLYKPVFLDEEKRKEFVYIVSSTKDDYKDEYVDYFLEMYNFFDRIHYHLLINHPDDLKIITDIFNIKRILFKLIHNFKFEINGRSRA